MENDNICIVPPELWPRFFGLSGLYDISGDKIFVKGGLPAEARERVINHEKAHRTWWRRRNPLTTKLCCLLFGSPGVVFVAGVLSVLASMLFSGNYATLQCWGIAGSALFLLHIVIWLGLFEWPAQRVDSLNNVRFAGKRAGAKFTFGPALPYLPFIVLTLVGILFGGAAFFLLSDAGLLAAWLLQLYYNYFALRVLRRAAPTLAAGKN